MPLYQTTADKLDETHAMATLATAWGYRMKKLTDLDRIDRFVLDKDRVIGAIEYKDRKYPMNAFPTVFLAFRKHRDLLIASLDAGVKPLFVVGWSCGAMRWIDVREVPMKLVIRGRTDRGAGNDLEPVTEVPITAMHTIAENPWR